MDARQRKATELEKRMALGRLFSALPVRHGEAADQVEVYLIALEDVTFYALDAVVKATISGRHPKLGKKFAPTTAELGEAIHDEMEQVSRLIEAQAEKLRLADHRPIAVRAPNYEERQELLRQQMADENRKIVFTVTSHDDFLRKRKHLPKGGVYHAVLGEAYGPPGWVPPAPEPPKVAEQEPQPEPAPQAMDVDW